MAVAFVDSFFANWETIAVTAAAFSVIGSIVMILVGRLFEMRNLEQMAKTELVYAASTILIVLMIIGIFHIAEPRLVRFAHSVYFSSLGVDSTTLVPLLPDGTPVATLIDYVKLYMAAPMRCVTDFMWTMYLLSIPVEALASVFMEIFMSEHASGFGFKWVAERITNTTQMLTFYSYIYYVLIHILNFVKHYGGFFFSIGVVLRAFPPTRGAGAYLMALAIGLYFIFPLTYILISAISLPHIQANFVTVDPSQVRSASLDPSEIPGLASPGIDRPETSGSDQGFYVCSLPEVPTNMDDLGCSGEAAPTLMRMRSVFFANREVLESLLTLHLGELTRHLMASMCIFPLVSFVVLITFVLNTTNLFGGNIPEIGRGLIKLI